MNNYNVLVLDDEPDIRELIELTLSRMEINCEMASNLAEAYQLINDHKFDLCLTDMRLPDGNGIELVGHIQEHHPQLPVAVITAFGSTELAVESLKAGAFDFIEKPVDLLKLRELVSSAIKLEELEPSGIDQQNLLLGESQPMQKVRSMIQKLARSQAPVFISGESGTGKELVARQIHNLSPRHDQAFIPVNCGAIPAELMESEFFGHKKGSFTGATQHKEGLFQAANEGTLFLDEVAELPLAMQVKLLRAIQESSVRPVGGHTEQHVNVRILSASNKDLKKLVDEGKFRNDLYFRLNVISLELPPLRERGTDIELLARHMLQQLGNQSSIPSLDDGALATLKNYHFPGNIRELENILERATTLTDSNIIHAEDLHLYEANQPGECLSENNGPTTQAGTRGSMPLEDYLAEIEHREIKAALEAASWNHAQTAKLLGLSGRQLRYKLTKFGIKR